MTEKTEIEALREEVAALRREVAGLRADRTINHYYHGGPPPSLLPQGPRPSYPGGPVPAYAQKLSDPWPFTHPSHRPASMSLGENWSFAGDSTGPLSA